MSQEKYRPQCVKVFCRSFAFFVRQGPRTDAKRVDWMLSQQINHPNTLYFFQWPMDLLNKNSVVCKLTSLQASPAAADSVVPWRWWPAHAASCVAHHPLSRHFLTTYSLWQSRSSSACGLLPLQGIPPPQSHVEGKSWGQLRSNQGSYL